MTFPNVPNVPGVPPLLRAFLPVLNTIQPLSFDTFGGFGFSPAPQWGIFKNGQPVVTADSVQRIEYRQDWDMLDYPLEQGAFESYNKVNGPFEAKVRFATGGTEADRQALLSSIEAIASTLEFYDVVTPEKIYQSTNIVHFDYSRTAANGVGLLQVDVWLLEIRVNATAQFSNTQADASADPVNDGTVQTTDPVQKQIDAMYNEVRRQEPTP